MRLLGASIAKVAAFALVVGVGACSNPPPPNPAAARVHVSDAEPPDNFEQIGPLSASDGGGCGLYGRLGRYERVIEKLRIAAAEQDADYVAIVMIHPPHFRQGCRVNTYAIEAMGYRKIADAPSPLKIDATISERDQKNASEESLPGQLRELDELHRGGALTDEEFERAKQRLLSE